MQNVVWFIDIPVSTGLMRQTQQKSFYLRFNLCHLDFVIWHESLVADHQILGVILHKMLQPYSSVKSIGYYNKVSQGLN